MARDEYLKMIEPDENGNIFIHKPGYELVHVNQEEVKPICSVGHGKVAIIGSGGLGAEVAKMIAEKRLDNLDIIIVGSVEELIIQKVNSTCIDLNEMALPELICTPCYYPYRTARQKRRAEKSSKSRSKSLSKVKRKP